MNCWWSKDVGLLALLISLVISTTATVEGKTKFRNPLQWYLVPRCGALAILF